MPVSLVSLKVVCGVSLVSLNLVYGVTETIFSSVVPCAECFGEI
jgi:hypothetical protein